MGEVYQAHDAKLGRDVAIKVLPEAFAHDPERLSRFQREAKMLAALNHPNIATIHGMEQSNGTSYLVMELVAGETLADRVKREGAVPVEEALRISIQIAEALEAAHEKGIIHRDLKPANVKVTPEGRVKVLDFGLAKAFAEDSAQDLSQLPTVTVMGTEEGKILGTPAYMSPEQARGKAVDKRTDIWAFGCVLYELMTGKRAFRGETTQDTIAAVLEHDPDWQALPPLTPARTCDLLRRCLEKDPQRRLRDIGDVRIEIEEASAVPAMGEPTGATKNIYVRRREALLWGVVLLLLAAVASIAIWSWRSSSPILVRGGLRPIESLAVLPLEELSGSPEQDYFADGMTDELITDLAQIKALRVISRTSVMLYKGAHKSLPDIARELNVDAVVEGTVLHSGNRVRITAQLVSAPMERHLWAQSYERDVRDVLGLQREVANAIADEIRIKVTPEEHVRLSGAPPVNSEAYEAYLKGRYYWETRSEEGLRKAIGYFQQAIEKDPTSPRAYSGLADSYNALGSDEFLPPMEAFPQAKAAALEALRRDQNFAEAHASLAFAIWNYDYDWKAVETEYKRAIDLNPGYATSYHWYAGYLSGMGRFAEAIAAVKRARELDPLSSRINANVGFILYFARQYDQAIEELQRAVRMDPDGEAPYYYLGLIYLQKGDYRQAISEFEKSKQLSSGGWEPDLELAQVYALAGDRKETQIILGRSLAKSKRNYESALTIAKVYVALGEKEKAFTWLQKAYVERSSLLTFLSVDPTLDVLHTDPRFQALLTRMNLQPHL
jgi:TolB-like protein/Tfp pilus assembly protein PilF